MSATTADAAIGCIDHLVIVADDLETGAETYRKLGFTLSPKGVHSAAMGSANHTIMLQNDYFELLAVVAPTERNARWRQALDEGGGVAGIALTTQDASAAYAHWLSQGLSPKQPIRFAREVVRADGAQMEARFEVVSLAEIPDTGMRIFVCSQPTREAVWLPELTEHANTAQAIERLSIACADPAAAAAQWRRVVPGLVVETAAHGVNLRTGPHVIELLDHETARSRYDLPFAPGVTRAVGIAYRVGSLDACRAVLSANGIPHSQAGGALSVPPEAACQVGISFLQD